MWVTKVRCRTPHERSGVIEVHKIPSRVEAMMWRSRYRCFDPLVVRAWSGGKIVCDRKQNKQLQKLMQESIRSNELICYEIQSLFINRSGATCLVNDAVSIAKIATIFTTE